MAKDSRRSPKLAPAQQSSLHRESSHRLGVAPAPRLPEPQDPIDEALALESARYIAQMSGELAVIARSANLDLLAYFLEMARVEATSSIRKLEGAVD